MLKKKIMQLECIGILLKNIETLIKSSRFQVWIQFQRLIYLDSKIQWLPILYRSRFIMCYQIQILKLLNSKFKDVLSDSDAEILKRKDLIYFIRFGYWYSLTFILYLIRLGYWNTPTSISITFYQISCYNSQIFTLIISHHAQLLKLSDI